MLKEHQQASLSPSATVDITVTYSLFGVRRIRSKILRYPLLALSGHAFLHCTCLLLTQTGHERAAAVTLAAPSAGLVQCAYERHCARCEWSLSASDPKRTLRKDYSARHASGRRPRRSTRRPKALLPPRQTAPGEPVHIVHIQDGGHVLLSWVVSTHEGLVLFYRFTQPTAICF